MTTTTAPTYAPLVVGSKFVVEKGCLYFGISKGTRGVVREVTEGEGREARVLLAFNNGKSLRLYTRHINRLSDLIVSLHNGDPTHKLGLRRALPKEPSYVYHPRPRRRGLLNVHRG